jgi:hypothetical protein
MAASLTYTFKRRCAGGGHFAVDVAFNGTLLGEYVYSTDEARAALSELTQNEREAAALLILKLRLQGLTRNQIVTLFNNPVTVSIQP